MGERVAVLVKVAEKFKAPVMKLPGCIHIAGYIIIDQLGGCRVVAHNDETRGNIHTFRLPCRIGVLVVSVQGIQRILQ